MLVGNRHARFLLVSGAAMLAFIRARPGLGQEILLTGPLRAAPAGHRLWRAERLELALLPGASVGSNDAPALLGGAEALYYPWDRFGAGLYATFALPFDAYGETELQGMVTPELALVPFAGKVHPFWDDLQYDLHLDAGYGRVFAEQHGVSNDAWTPWAGVGFRAFSASFFSNSLDYRLVAGAPLRHVFTLSFAWWPLDRHWSDE